MSASLLRAAEVEPLLRRLEAARERVARRPLASRLDSLGRLVDAWLDDGDGLRAVAAEVAAGTGYAAPMVEASLRRTLRAHRRGHLAALLDGMDEAEIEAAEPPRLVLVVLAQSTPGLALGPTLLALLLGSAVLVKPASGSGAFAARLAGSIEATDPELSAAVAVRSWRGGDLSVERPLLARASKVVAYGSAATMAALGELAGDRLIAHGPRASVAVLAGPEATSAATARELARQVAFLDQRGCLSPQAVLLDARVGPVASAELGRRLAAELEAIERRWPRRRLTLEEAAAFRRAADEAEIEALKGAVEAFYGGGAAPWAVVVERGPTLRPSPLDRFVRIHPFGLPFDPPAMPASGTEAARDGPEQALAAALRPLRDRLECVGLLAPEGERAALAAACRRAGAIRVCRLEEMQDPPAEWASGGKHPLRALLRAPKREADAGEQAGSRREAFLRHLAQTSDEPRAIEVASARGSIVRARDGRAYLDLLAGIGVAAIGHAHPEVARAVGRQARRFAHVMVYGEDVLAPQVDLAQRLVRILPPALSSVYLVSSGAEAIEGALKLVRKTTGRERVLAFEGAYHGDTTGAMALGGNPFYREPFRPLLEVEHLPWNEERALARIDESVAAVFAEPVQAEAGVRIPDAAFLPSLARRCRAVGALLVLDEVVTGLGRTGRWFGFQHWPGAEPDVLVLAKALGGGLPLGAFVAARERMEALSRDPPLGHITTFGGNPVSCAAALATLDVLERERLIERSASLGASFRDELRRLAGRGPLVAVRGIGLLIGLEFDSPERARTFVGRCFERGVLLGWTLHRDTTVRLAPPLTIRRAEIDRALEVIEASLAA